MPRPIRPLALPATILPDATARANAQSARRAAARARAELVAIVGEAQSDRIARRRSRDRVARVDHFGWGGVELQMALLLGIARDGRVG